MELNVFYRIYYKLFLGELDLNKLNTEQKELTIINIKKHTHIFLLMLLTLPYTYYILSNFYVDKIDVVMTALLGALFVSGTAWFAITFGAIPERFMNFAIKTTAYLFTAFAVSLTAVFAVGLLEVPLISPILFIIFISLYTASVKYDVVDALKIGIDEAIFKHAKVGRVYFLKQLKKE